MSNNEIIEKLANLRDDLKHDLRNSTDERKDKLTAVIGHLQYAIRRMESTIA